MTFIARQNGDPEWWWQPDPHDADLHGPYTKDHFDQLSAPYRFLMARWLEQRTNIPFDQDEILSVTFHGDRYQSMMVERYVRVFHRGDKVSRGDRRFVSYPMSHPPPVWGDSFRVLPHA